MRGKKDMLKAVKWTIESDIAGPSKWECGQMLFPPHLDSCDKNKVETFRGYTHILNDNVGSLSRVTGNVFLLANNASRDLQPCIVGPHAFREATWSVHNPLRVVVDAQYINRPRCCHGSEVDGLVLNDAGEYKQWTLGAIAHLENITAFGMSFYRRKPTVNPCTEEEPCPLVIQIPGAGGNPWFLIQSNCTACQKELGAVIISPFLERDMHLPTGDEVGTSNLVLKASLIPFLDAYIPAHPDIDPQRVYVVAQSQGDDTALRLALLRPDLISLVSLSGKNAISNETMEMLQWPGLVLRVQSSPRLKYIQWNIGDLDTVFEDADYYWAFAKQIRTFTPGALPTLDLRIYPQSFHSVWWAAWNALHEIIWTGQRWPLRAATALTTTCPGAESWKPAG